MLRRSSSTEPAQRERKSRRKNKLRNSSYNYEGGRKQENLNIDPKGLQPCLCMAGITEETRYTHPWAAPVSEQ